MKCIIAEKPSVAQSIAKIVGAKKRNDGYLEGDGYLVTWAYGHLVTLALPESYGWQTYDKAQLPMIPSSFRHIVRLVKKGKEWKPDSSASKQLKVIKSCFDQSDSIVVATDAGREGELIFRYIYNFLGCRKPFERLWISSLTDSAIKQGLQSLKPGTDFDSLYEAGRLRSEADWLVGMNGSRAMSIVQQGVYSVGRVQTPTLCMVSQRFEKNRDFQSVLFWRLTCQVHDGGKQYKAHGVDKYEDKDKADSLLSQLSSTTHGVVQNVTIKQKDTPPPLLFDLTGLQKEANKRYDLSADQTLKIAQTLYERKLITYPRTGSCYISEDVLEEVPHLLNSITSHPVFGRFAIGLLAQGLNKRSVNATKVTDHHALLITGEQVDEMISDEEKIYNLILMRMLEAFSPISQSESYLCTFSVGATSFDLRLTRLKVAGWKEIGLELKSQKEEAEEGSEEESEVLQFPAFKTGDQCPVSTFELIESKTKPLPLYTEATLLNAMEHAGQKVDDEALRSALSNIGIGTPATRASIIETLIQRGYMVRKKKNLEPTDKGLFLYHNLRDTALGNVELTGKWENALTQIEEGKISPAAFDSAIKEFTKKITDELLSIPVNTALGSKGRGNGTSGSAIEPPCPKCGSSLTLYPKLVKCNSCDFKVWREICGVQLDADQLSELITTGDLPRMIVFKSKKGNMFSAGLHLNQEENKVEFVFDYKKK